MGSSLRVLVTSVVRHAGHQQVSGRLRVIELDTGRMLLTAAVRESPYRAQDPNPRGGLRGVRGIAANDHRLVVANADTLFLFDTEWRLVGELTHRWMGGVHEILADPDGVWVTCTNADLLLKLGWDGRVQADWEWRRDPALAAALGLPRPPPVDRRLDYRDPRSMRTGVRNLVHLNAVARGTEGLLVLLGRVLSRSSYRAMRRQALVGRLVVALGIAPRPSPLSRRPPTDQATAISGSAASIVHVKGDGRAELLRRLPGLRVPNHNVLQVGDRLVYNDTNHARVVTVPLRGGGPERWVTIPGEPAFVRGLVPLDRDTVLVGSQCPAAVYRIDLARGLVTATLPLDGEPHESVFGLALLPDSFNDPPGTLQWRG